MAQTVKAGRTNEQIPGPVRAQLAAFARERKRQYQGNPDYSILLNATNIAPTNVASSPVCALDIVQGTEGVYQVTIVPRNGFSADVQITCFLWIGAAMPINCYPPPAGLTVFTPFTMPAVCVSGYLYIGVDKTVSGVFSGILVATAAGAKDSRVEWFTLTVHSPKLQERGLDGRHRDKTAPKAGEIQEKRGDTLNRNLPRPIPQFSPNARLSMMRAATGKVGEDAVRRDAKTLRPDK